MHTLAMLTGINSRTKNVASQSLVNPDKVKVKLKEHLKQQ
jgi:hypothetical protein